MVKKWLHRKLGNFFPNLRLCTWKVHKISGLLGRGFPKIKLAKCASGDSIFNFFKSFLDEGPRKILGKFYLT